jgi:5'-nucleotidase (lipoprotein e(P4) family)
MSNHPPAFRALLALGLCCVPALCGGAPPAEGRGREQLNAVLWMQAAAEYRAIVEQTFRLATERLAGPALQPGTAALEQVGMDPLRLASLPTAIIVDLDETILDNSFHQARLAREGRDYDEAAWQAWMQEAAAPALPGAQAFLQGAAKAGHTVFYVTNRDCLEPVPGAADPCPAKTATQRNLRALDLPGADAPDQLLMRGERPEWRSSDKSLRRAWIAERFRVLALIGDDLRDFVDRPVYEARRQELAPLLGARWFLLPNAMYGSWERALAAGACEPGLPAPECGQRIVERKYARLETLPPPLVLPGSASWSGSRERLRLATWNVEYLVEPATYAALAGSCVTDGGKVSGSDRRLPCAIVPRLDRGPADFAALRGYAAQLDADVVALQEVDGPGAAALILPGYEFCFTVRPNVQKNGFAIRRGLPFRCEAEYEPLSVGDRFRRGVVVTLFPGTGNEMALMNVHLKSGCPAGPLTDSNNPACADLAAQVAPLEAWIDAQARAGRRFGLLGDFNRRLAQERGPARDKAGRLQNLWAEIDDREPAGAALFDVTARAPFVKCVATDPYDAYIDVVVLGRDLARQWVRDSFRRVAYTVGDYQQHGLSDHCPVGIELQLR